LLAGLASLAVFPLQAARGWRFGGTYELNQRTLPIAEPVFVSAVGFARSVYTFLKTVPWLGEWSFFRAPKPLLLLFLGLTICAIGSARFHRSPRSPSHLIAAAFAFAGFTLFAIANRRYFGVWGGVGGWYAWTWAPWLREAATDHIEFRRITATRLLFLETATILAFNVVFLHDAFRLYR
jgi:hypothetical protein